MTFPFSLLPSPCSPICSHVEEEEEQLRRVAGPGRRADDDPEVTQFYVNPIAKPIPQGRAHASLQDTISDLNMHKGSRNGLEVRTRTNITASPSVSSLAENERHNNVVTISDDELAAVRFNHEHETNRRFKLSCRISGTNKSVFESQTSAEQIRNINPVLQLLVFFTASELLHFAAT